MISRLIFMITFVILHLIKNLNANGMVEVFKWRQIDYYNRGNNNRKILQAEGAIYFPEDYRNNTASYIPYNNIPMGATHYKGRLFVTVPRRRIGIPSTLNYIDLNKDGKQQSPKLIAYPNFEINQFESHLSVKLVSVYRTNVDKYDRMWFIDTGMLEYPDNPVVVQPPAIWVIDLKTDKVIRRFEIPSSIITGGSQGLASITPDTDSGYAKTFAYIPDLLNNRLHVYSFESNKIWSFSHNYFHFDPVAGDLTIGGQTFRWNDGIFSVSLGPKHVDGSRFILFHAMASNNEFFVNNRVLQDERNAQRGDHGTDFVYLGLRGNNFQSTMHAYDNRTGVVFYAEIQRNGVGCWNSHKQFTPPNQGQVAHDENTMIYPSDLTIDDEGSMWVMTNSMPIFIYSTLDANDFNFRVWSQNTVKAIENTLCAE